MNVGETTPTIYILHGEDELAISEFIASILNKYKDPATADLNTTHLDGRSASLEELSAVANALPFLARRRLIILEHPLTRLKTTQIQKRFIEILDNTPQSTALVLVEYTDLTDYRGKWLKEVRWIGYWIDKAGERVFQHAFPLPSGGEMIRWIVERTKAMGGSITNQAASTLASLTGDDTRLADLEITKLLDYVNYSRSVEIEDVQALTPDASRVDDFALVEALRKRDTRSAQAVLHRKLDEEEPMLILGSMIYQFRLLLLAREIIDQGGGQKAVIDQLAQFKISPYPAKLAYENAFRYTTQSLEDIYRYLLEMDEAIKTGRIPADLALDLFTVQVTG